MRLVYIITLFVCSSLLFLVEPMVAKMILPTFGGSPSVWNACVLFFQTVLLLGYLYAHVTTKWLGAKKQAVFHLCVMLLPLLVLPIAIRHWDPRGSSNPTFLLLGLLTVMAGLPFFVLSAGAPLLQTWFANTNDKDAKDPYFLYRASNLGSMVALIAYPAFFEPTFRLADQSRYWAYGYGALIALVAGTAYMLWKNPGLAPVAPIESETETEPEKAVTWNDRAKWIALSAVPSSLMLGVTTFLTTNISPIPLLWVIPLALYLLTFVIGFASKPFLSGKLLSRIFPLVATPMAVVLLLESNQPILAIAGGHLLLFFLTALMCHTILNESRPSASHLTEFYLWISVGGVIGGLFNSLLAPMIFKTVAEYPVAIIAACFLRKPVKESRWTRLDWIYPLFVGAVMALIIAFVDSAPYNAVRSHLIMAVRDSFRVGLLYGLTAVLCFIAVDRPFRYGASMAFFMGLAILFQVNSGGHQVLLDRSFFGVHKVAIYDAVVGEDFYPKGMHMYAHGNTIHGQQLVVPKYRRQPCTYYYPTGPIGQVITKLNEHRLLNNLALVGLGTGSLAAYGKPGQKMDFYEIDPKVVWIARDSGYFTYVTDSQAKINYILGDARLSLVDAPDHTYDLIVLDAFSSDAIPVHLITKQALDLYASKLKPNGVIAFHISNRYLNLRPIVANLAGSLGMLCLVQGDYSFVELEKQEGKFDSKWVILTPSKETYKIFDKDPRWDDNPPNPKYPIWTDDYSNILRVFESEKRNED